MTFILALLTGMGLGYIVERVDLCFHSTLRGLFRRPAQLDLFRAYLLSLLIAAPLVQGLIVVYALSLIVTSLAVDLLYGYLNPKIRYA